MKMVPSHLAPDKKSETVSVFPNISNNSSKDSWIKLYTSWCMSDQTHISWQVWAPWDGGLYVARGTFQRPSVKPAAQRQTTLVLCQNLWHLDKHNACYWSVNKGTTVMKKAGAVLLTWWKETGETSKRMSVFKDGTSDLTILCGWKLPDDKEENYIELLLSKSTHTHTHKVGYTLSVEYRSRVPPSLLCHGGTRYRMKATRLPSNSSSWHKRTSRRMRECYIYRKNENVQEISHQKIWPNLTSVFIFGTRNIHCGLQFNPQHFSEPGTETAKQRCPEKHRDTDYCKLHFTPFLHCILFTVTTLTFYKPHYTVFDCSNLPWHFVVT